LPGFSPGPLDVVNAYGDGHRGPAGLRQSCDIRAPYITVVDSIPVTTVSRTLFDLAAVVRKSKLERAIDNALALGLVTPAALHQIVELLGEHGRAGTTVMRELVGDRGEGYVATESELEDAFLAFLVQFGLPEPVRQVVLGDETPVGRVDFFFPEAKVVVELDGRRNHTAFLDREADYVRDSRLTAMGIRVMRITWRRLKREPQAVAEELRSALRLAA